MVLCRLNFACFCLKLQERIKENHADRSIQLMLRMTNGFRRKRVLLTMVSCHNLKAREKCWSVPERFEMCWYVSTRCIRVGIFKQDVQRKWKVDWFESNRGSQIDPLLLVVGCERYHVPCTTSTCDKYSTCTSTVVFWTPTYRYRSRGTVPRIYCKCTGSLYKKRSNSKNINLLLQNKRLNK